MRQEAFVRVDLAGLVVANQRLCRHVHVHALEAELQTQGVRGLPQVLDVQLCGFSVERVFPLGQQRIALELQEVTGRERRAGFAVKATSLFEVIVFGPQAGAQRVGACLVGQFSHETGTVDHVFRGADRQRCAAGSRQIRRAPQALAFVVVEVGGALEAQTVLNRQVQRHIGQVVLAQAGRVPVSIVQAVHATGEVAACGSNGAGVVGEVVVPVTAQATDHVLGHVLIVVLGAVGIAVVRRHHGLANGLYQLQVDVVLILFTGPFPLVGLLGGRADEELRAGAQRAAVHAQEKTLGAVTADRRIGHDAERVFRIRRGEFQCAAQIAGGCCGQCAGALGKGHTAHVLGHDGAADVQAVVVGVGHVAQRHAVQREAHLVLVEATHHDAGGPLVGAVGVGGLEVHAWQLLDGLERAGAGGELRQLFGIQALHLTRLTLTEDADLLDLGRLLGKNGFCGKCGECCQDGNTQG